MKPHGIMGLWDKYQPFIVFGALVVVGGIGYALWSNGNGEIKTITVSRGEFVQQVSVSGKVMADQEVDLGFSQGGRIQGVYAKEGQMVAKGALVAEIENGDLYASLVQKRAALDREEAKLDALKRGTRPEEIAVAESAVAAAEAALKANHQAVIDAIVTGYATADGGVHTTADQFFSNPNSSSPQVTFYVSNSTIESLVESERAAIELTLLDWQQQNANLTIQSDLDDPAAKAQAYLGDVSKFLNDASAALAASIPTTSVSQTTLDAYKADVTNARGSVNTAASALTSALKSYTAAETALVTAERDLALKRAGSSAEDIRAQAASVAAAEADVLSATAQLEKTQIRAPFKGTVTKIVAKIGENALPSVPQVSLIGSGTFEIESFVPELNIPLIAVGDPATVTFDSYGPSVIFPAEVLSVDLGETERDGVTTYRTVLVFKERDDRVRSGMTANVVILTEAKSEVIAIPQALVIHKGGGTYVTVKVGDAIEERQVVVGSVSSVGDIEIVSGLEPGDQVVIP